MIELPTWKLTQRRSQKGGSKWCAFVLEGSDPRLDAVRPILPVLRPTGWKNLEEGDLYEATPEDVPDHYNWWVNGPRRWRDLLQTGLLVTAREHIGPLEGGSVGPYFGVFEIDEAEVSSQHLRVRAGSKVAEVAG